MPRLWTNVHQLDGTKPWTLLQPAQRFSGNSSATRRVAESWQSQGTLVLLQRFCSNRLWKLSRCVEGWLCFTQRTLYVFLTGGSNTFMKTPSERGRKAWMLQHLIPMSHMDTLLSASRKQSQRPPLMSANLRERENTLNVGSERTSVQEKNRGHGANPTSFTRSFPKCTGEILRDKMPRSFWWRGEGP